MRGKASFHDITVDKSNSVVINIGTLWDIEGAFWGVGVRGYCKCVAKHFKKYLDECSTTIKNSPVQGGINSHLLKINSCRKIYIGRHHVYISIRCFASPFSKIKNENLLYTFVFEIKKVLLYYTQVKKLKRPYLRPFALLICWPLMFVKCLGFYKHFKMSSGKKVLRCHL